MTHTRAAHRYWLDIDAQSDGVSDCAHLWQTSPVNFLVETYSDEEVTLCARCFVPRCPVTYYIPLAHALSGARAAKWTACSHPLRHEGAHRFWVGQEWRTISSNEVDDDLRRHIPRRY